MNFMRMTLIIALSRIGKYIEQQYIDGYTPYNTIKSCYKEMDYGYFYLQTRPHESRIRWYIQNRLVY